MKEQPNNQKSRTNAALANVIAGLVSHFVKTITNMILPPLIISTFGSAVNGLLSAIKQLLSYAQLFGAGISTASMQSLYKPLHDNDAEAVSRTLAATKRTFRKSGYGFLGAVFLVAGIYPFFVSSQPFHLTALLTILCGVAGASEFFYMGRYRTLLGADQRSYITSTAESVGALISVTVSVIFLFLTKNIIFVQLGGTLLFLFRIIIPAWYVRSNYSYINVKAEPDMLALRKRKDVVVHSFAGAITLNSQTIILSLVDKLKLASVFSVYNLVFAGLQSLLSSIVNTLTASIGSLMVSSTEEKIRGFYNTYSFFFYQIMFSVYATAAVLLLPFVKLYTQNATDINYVDPVVATMFVIVAILNAIRIPAITFINATGHFKETKGGAVVETILSVSIQLLTVKKFGIQGILFGTIVALLFRSNQVIIYVCRKILKISVWKTYKKIMINLFVSSGLLFIMLQLGPDINSWFSWVINAAIVFVFNFMVLLLVNYLTDKKAGLNAFSYFKSIVKNKKSNS